MDQAYTVSFVLNKSSTNIMDVPPKFPVFEVNCFILHINGNSSLHFRPFQRAWSAD